MSAPESSPRPLAAPFARIVFVTALGLAGCDPGHIVDIWPDGPPPSGGQGGGTGGAAGGGCVEKVLCAKGFVFDSSPMVCACVAISPPPPPPSSCASVTCPTGFHCEENAVMCVTAPCPPVAGCVPNAPGVFCGGLASIACPGSGTCVDDPDDGCDPKAGGADCGGICQCVQTVLCTVGAMFDSSPKVCACVPQVTPPPPPPVCGPVCDIYCEYGNVPDANGCPTCACNPPPKPDPCAAIDCAPGTHCEAAPVMCVKAPCPPVGACVPDAPAVTCGGFANLPCPGGGQCVDNPNDGCDPKAGGADCGGICQCVQTVACAKGATFDSSPKVCACVPSPNPPPPPKCGPVCQIFCAYENVLDSQGCPTCACNPAPKKK